MITAASAQAQVMVAPVALFLEPRTNFGTFLVSNQAGEPQEVQIEFRFGYPVSDSAGNATMVYGDSLPLVERSLQGRLRAFPRQFTLQPGQQQSVRIAVTPDASWPAGVYWTRLVTTSTPQSARADSIAPGVSAQITMRLEQITTVLYKKGGLEGRLSIDSAWATADSQHVHVVVPLTLEGNAPFFGTIEIDLRDSTGRVVASDIEVFAMYTAAARRFSFLRSALPAGEYDAVIRARSERPDIPATDAIPFPAASRTVRVQMPPP